VNRLVSSEGYLYWELDTEGKIIRYSPSASSDVNGIVFDGKRVVCGIDNQKKRA
jgi:urease beta subunit